MGHTGPLGSNGNKINSDSFKDFSMPSLLEEMLIRHKTNQSNVMSISLLSLSLWGRGGGEGEVIFFHIRNEQCFFSEISGSSENSPVCSESH